MFCFFKADFFVNDLQYNKHSPAVGGKANQLEGIGQQLCLALLTRLRSGDKSLHLQQSHCEHDATSWQRVSSTAEEQEMKSNQYVNITVNTHNGLEKSTNYSHHRRVVYYGIQLRIRAKYLHSSLHLSAVNFPLMNQTVHLCLKRHYSPPSTLQFRQLEISQLMQATDGSL